MATRHYFVHSFYIMLILTLLHLLSLRSKCWGFFYLQWNLTKTPTSWGGLIVKVKFKCEDVGDETEHCVVVKYTGTFKGNHYSIKSLI